MCVCVCVCVCVCIRHFENKYKLTVQLEIMSSFVLKSTIFNIDSFGKTIDCAEEKLTL